MSRLAVTELRSRLRRPATERGFTLIELLVVIIILGILAAVVVFAVSGVGDKGKSSAVTIDQRTLKTAQEAYCAKNGRYADGATLLAEGFLSDLPEYHQVFASQTGGNCNGWRYAVLRTEEASPYPPGKWEFTTGQPMSPPMFDPDPGSADEWVGDIVRLADGRVLALSDLDVPGAEIWDPSTGLWTDVTPYEQDRSSFDALALVLRDDPNTPQSECAAGAVDNCNKVFYDAFGAGFLSNTFYLFDPDNPAADWEPIEKPASSETSNIFTRLGMVQLMDDPSRAGSQCGTNCGKVFIYGSGASTGDLYDPRDNSFTPVVFDDPSVTPNLGIMAPLPDGRYLMVGDDANTGNPVAKFFDPATLMFTSATPPDVLHGQDRFREWALLPSGEILFAGPSFEVGSFSNVAQAEIYTPQAAPGGGTWRTVPGCNAADFANNQVCHVVDTLPDGRVLAFTGYESQRFPQTSLAFPSFQRETFVFNPATEKWNRAADLNDLFTALDGVLLDPAGGRCDPHCGKVLLVGGGKDGGTARSSSELFTP